MPDCVLLSVLAEIKKKFTTDPGQHCSVLKTHWHLKWHTSPCYSKTGITWKSCSLQAPPGAAACGAGSSGFWWTRPSWELSPSYRVLCVADILMVVFRICFGSNLLFYLCRQKDLETGAELKSVGIVTSTGVNTATFGFSISAERRMAVLP